MDIVHNAKVLDFKFDKSSNLTRLKNSFKDTNVVRFSISNSYDDKIVADYSYTTTKHETQIDVFDFNPRKYVNNSTFNAVMVIPTGIGAETGGDSGDACVNAKLIGSVVDNLITHPNVVNAADFNEMTPNTLYVEGSILNRFMLGTVGLAKSSGNRILLIYDNPTKTHNGEDIPKHIINCTINAASSTRMTIGVDVDTLGIDNPPFYQCFYDEKDMAIGKVLGIDTLVNIIEKYKNDYDCFALHTIITPSDDNISAKYFGDEIEVNPWGGVEALITHTISNILNIPSAHAPMLADGTFSYPYDVVHPTKAPETLSKTELFCLLKGLSYAPKIITDKTLMDKTGVLTNEDINCLIIPDRCIGLPILAALEQDIPVIVVEDGQNMMKNDLDKLPWKPNKFFRAKNYLEVVGYINCLKTGIMPKNIIRPIQKTNQFYS